MLRMSIGILLVAGILTTAAAGQHVVEPAEIPASLPAANGTLPAEVHHAGPMAEMAYQAAIDRPEIVSSVPCLCGCIESLGHASNLDCYIDRDTAGGVTIYSSHGLYCGVCQLITRDALDGAARGMSADELRAMVVERYGS